jgi:PIN domain nuclease of toxin-antitoxin system
VKYLLDTHLLLGAAGTTQGGIAEGGLSAAAVEIIGDPGHQLYFSSASIWEVAIKAGLGRQDFKADPQALRRGLLDNGYLELAISSEHAAAVGLLPALHKDPFDRALVAQARIEGLTLLTSDREVAEYPGPIQKV